VHLATRGHFQSGDKDGRHTIRSAKADKPMLHVNLMALCFIVPQYGRSKFYIVGIGIFNYFVHVTATLPFIYKLDPYFLEIHQMCKRTVSTTIFLFCSCWGRRIFWRPRRWRLLLFVFFLLQILAPIRRRTMWWGQLSVRVG